MPGAGYSGVGSIERWEKMKKWVLVDEAAIRVITETGSIIALSQLKIRRDKLPSEWSQFPRRIGDETISLYGVNGQYFVRVYNPDQDRRWYLLVEQFPWPEIIAAGIAGVAAWWALR